MMVKDCGSGVLVMAMVFGLGMGSEEKVGQGPGWRDAPTVEEALWFDFEGMGWRLEASGGDPCVGDIQPPPFGDGDVDFMDLIMLINRWGNCCSSDVFPANGDGKIDVNDLIFVMNAWGICEECGADVFPVGGDGVVDILDLVFVVNDLGLCTETADYDCVEDFLPPGGDGQVNMMELVAVVNGFENCVPTTE